MTTFTGNRMDGKICVVTGATQGLGAAIARRLAAAGAAGIIITGRNAERGAQVAREIAEAHGIGAHFLKADFGRIEDCRMVIAETDRQFGRIDVLVNAGPRPRAAPSSTPRPKPLTNCSRPTCVGLIS